MWLLRANQKKVQNRSRPTKNQSPPKAHTAKKDQRDPHLLWEATLGASLTDHLLFCLYFITPSASFLYFMLIDKNKRLVAKCHHHFLSPLQGNASSYVSTTWFRDGYIGRLQLFRHGSSWICNRLCCVFWLLTRKHCIESELRAGSFYWL